MIHDRHWQEWLSSGVDDRIIELNVRSIDDAAEIDDILQRGQGRKKKKWEHWPHGEGWAVAGIAPTSGEFTYAGVQFKPDTPVLDGVHGDGSPKFRKYFGASGEGQAVPIFLDTGVDGYWAKVREDFSIPLFITEGAKKAGCLLTQGVPCISLPGVWNWGKLDRLKDPLPLFCQPGRTIYLAFDADWRTNLNVFNALDRLGRVLSAGGAVVMVLSWDGELGKGIDDFLAAGGELAPLIEKAQTFSEWRLEKPNPRTLKEKQSFYQQALKHLYQSSGDNWICVEGKLYKWTGTYYKAQYDEDEVRRLWNYCDTYQATIDGQITYPFASPGYIGKALSWIKAALSIAPELVNPPGLNCTNGVLHILWEGSTPRWELRPHSPASYYLYEPQAEYKPDAPTDDCDRLLKVLEPEELDIFEKTIAASLDLLKVRKVKGRMKALLLRGTGSNGKDTLREVVSMLYGRQGVTGCSFNDFAQYDAGRKFPLSKLQYSKINWASENSKLPNLDDLQSLKQVVTGDEIDFEGKGKDERSGATRCVLLFNCNEAPNMRAALDAIKTRYAVISFKKSFALNANAARGELEADPRYKYDPGFVQARILPAFLNRILNALLRLMTEGIDYKATEAALEEIQNENCHLYQFCQDAGLTEKPDGFVYVGEIWNELEAWYKENGTLEIDENGKRVWIDQVKRSDLNVKGVNQVLSRFLQLFPKAKRGVKHWDHGIRIDGVAFDRSKTTLMQPDANLMQPDAVCDQRKAIQGGDFGLKPDAVCQPDAVFPEKISERKNTTNSHNAKHSEKSSELDLQNQGDLRQVASGNGSRSGFEGDQTASGLRQVASGVHQVVPVDEEEWEEV